jgi:hypothetical protein
MTAWDRVKEAMHRDWEQTKHDVAVGGHQLNQGLTDTVKQALGDQSIPDPSKANPPKVIGDWDNLEAPMRYGHAARARFGAEHPQWTPPLEAKLRAEWEACADPPGRGWTDVRDSVRKGYEFSH